MLIAYWAFFSTWTSYIVDLIISCIVYNTTLLWSGVIVYVAFLTTFVLGISKPITKLSCISEANVTVIQIWYYSIERALIAGNGGSLDDDNVVISRDSRSTSFLFGDDNWRVEKSHAPIAANRKETLFGRGRRHSNVDVRSSVTEARGGGITFWRNVQHATPNNLKMAPTWNLHFLITIMSSK